MAYTQTPDGVSSEIWTVPVEGGREQGTLGVRLGRAELFLRIPYFAYAPSFSPDGRWLAYSSAETGIYEVYVRPFPGPGAKQQISTGGGRDPIWSPNGRELFFLTSDRRIMVAGYSTRGGSFTAGKPRVWSERPLAESYSSTFDVASDGKRVAGVLYADGTSEPKPSTHLTVLLNFVDELRRRVPAGGK